MAEASPFPELYRVAAATELRAGPGPDQKALRTLQLDQVVMLVGQAGQPWLEVEAPNGQRGFAPAGLLKRHEPPATGAARELFEESGVRIDPGDLVPARPNALVHPLGWVDMVYFGSVPASATPLTVDGGEVLEARWFPLDDLPPLTPNTESLLGVYGIGPAADRASADQAAGGARATTGQTADGARADTGRAAGEGRP